MNIYRIFLIPKYIFNYLCGNGNGNKSNKIYDINELKKYNNNCVIKIYTDSDEKYCGIEYNYMKSFDDVNKSSNYVETKKTNSIRSLTSESMPNFIISPYKSTKSNDCNNSKKDNDYNDHNDSNKSNNYNYNDSNKSNSLTKSQHDVMDEFNLMYYTKYKNV